MAKLIFNYYDMRGYYNFVADIEGKSEIMAFSKALNSGKSGEFLVDSEQDKLDAFFNAFEEAVVEDWDNEYLPTSVEDMLTDMPGFRVCYVDDNGRMYASQGEVRYAPEEYDKLIYAISKIDPSASDLLPDVTLGED